MIHTDEVDLVINEPKVAAEPVNLGRRNFLINTTTVLGGVGVAYAALPFLASWNPSARAIAAGEPVEVDISKLKEGQCITVEWRKKPVFVMRRSQAMIDELPKNDPKLKDPLSAATEQQPQYAQNIYRSIKPDHLVLIGICTHLGCVPLSVPEPKAKSISPAWPGGFFCPCHGSWYDLAGRVFKDMPAPLNLAVPEYHYSNDATIVIGKSAAIKA